MVASASTLRWQLPPGAAPADPNTEAAELIRSHLSGDQLAFQTLVGRFQGRLLNFIYRMIGDRERAEDLVQEAFVRVYRHLHRFDPARKFSTWIYTIASNLAKNELRNRGRSPLVMFSALRDRFRDDPLVPVQYEDLHSRADVMFHDRDLRELVEQTVARLSPRHREVFVLRELEGKSYEEIAEVMHCNIGTVKSRLNRARQSFAALIGPLLE
ncbi:MAG TPA: sigma-70 family RNA polymerase sigma factor [Gemmatimonadales bacterium]|nr:sigma-70 family RNA polymerase sigma factor [Gemmatimonadales bacterium]